MTIVCALMSRVTHMVLNRNEAEVEFQFRLKWWHYRRSGKCCFRHAIIDLSARNYLSQAVMLLQKSLY